MRLPTFLLLASLTPNATAQTVSFTKILAQGDLLRPYGHSPALEGGQLAFLGADWATATSAIYTTSADGLGAFTKIVDETMALPNVPGETFRFLDNPEVRAGVVTFVAGHALTSSLNDGIYQGSGGPISVYYDHSDPLAGPNPFEPIVTGDGLLFRSASSNPSNFLNGSQPYFSSTEGSIAPVVSGTLPGGGSLLGLQALSDTQSLGGGFAVLSADVNHGAGVDGAIYTWEIATDTLTLIADWTTPMPGTGLLFDNFWCVHTDGQQIVFVGQSGNLNFGGHQGVYATAVDGSGSLAVLAEVGDPAPGGGTFSSFDEVAVEGDLVLFLGNLGGAEGLFGWHAGQLFKVLSSNDMLDGADLTRVMFDARGLDGTRVAVRVAYPWSAGLEPTGLYVATIDLRDGPTIYCTAKASSAGCLASIGTSAAAQPTSGSGEYQVLASGVHSLKNGLLFASSSGASAVPFHGGLLCMTPPLKRGPVLTSGGVGPGTCTGAFMTEVNGGAVLPAGLDAGPGNSAWYQYWYRDPANGAGPLGTALSDAVQLDFE